jgi:Protein of unknown function (DUF2752)
MQIALLPEWLLSCVPLSRVQARPMNLLLSGVFVITVVALALDHLERLPHFCLFQRALGIPCPGCGILHSLNASFRCDFRNAWMANPAGLVLAFGLMLQVSSSALALVGSSVSRSAATVENTFGKAFVLVAVAVWAYRIAITLA